MARPKSAIYADVDPITGGGTEADMMCWVRVTEMLLQARAKREERLAAVIVCRTVLTISFSIEAAHPPCPLALAV